MSESDVSPEAIGHVQSSPLAVAAGKLPGPRTPTMREIEQTKSAAGFAARARRARPTGTKITTMTPSAPASPPSGPVAVTSVSSADQATALPRERQTGAGRMRAGGAIDAQLLVGDSEAMRRVTRLAEAVAQSDVTVLIEGESGTGKELVARLVHARSSRSGKPFIFVNCAALTETLVEAELFGHARGSFTGAVAEKLGRFHLADGGTLFLDEIGDLGAKGQGDLLRVLEDGAFRMVGGTALQRVDVRIIAATNKDLQSAVAEGKFREDLFYRLHIVPILVPPLRARPEDIPVLIETFLDHFSIKHKRRTKKMTAEAMQVCQRFPWPGNVRQLRNMVERLVVTTPHTLIGLTELPDFLATHERAAEGFTVRVGMTVAEVEKLLIRQTLDHLTSNRAKAAEALGISRRALQYKLRRYHLIEEASAQPCTPDEKTVQ
jgi:transcriptional regulator with PAS, ATPase and Fis domain